MLNILKLVLSPLGFVLKLFKPKPTSDKMLNDAKKMSTFSKMAMLRKWVEKHDA